MTTSTVYCNCETPVMDVEYDVGCRRCGLPANFAPSLPAAETSAGRDWATWGNGDLARLARHLLADSRDENRTKTQRTESYGEHLLVMFELEAREDV